MDRPLTKFDLMAMESIIKQMYSKLNKYEKLRVLQDLRYSINFELNNRSVFDDSGNYKKGKTRNDVII